MSEERKSRPKMSQWNTILTESEIEARNALTAALDPHSAAESRRFWSSRTINQLRVLRSQAWYCNDADGYQMAASYLALAEVPSRPSAQAQHRRGFGPEV